MPGKTLRFWKFFSDSESLTAVLSIRRLRVRAPSSSLGWCAANDFETQAVEKSSLIATLMEAGVRFRCFSLWLVGTDGLDHASKGRRPLREDAGPLIFLACQCRPFSFLRPEGLRDFARIDAGQPLDRL